MSPSLRRASRSRLRLLLALMATYVAAIVAISIATQHIFWLGLLGLVAVAAFPFRRR